MKNKNLILILFTMLFTVFIFSGCTNYINLNNTQQKAYDEVVEYSQKCSDKDVLNNFLNEIKTDISKVNNEDKLQIEIKIGKLKIDGLYLIEKENKEIQTEIELATTNKNTYKMKRDSITNIYYGSQSSYNAEILSLNSQISHEYSSYLRDVQNVQNNNNLGTGYKQQYQASRYNQYINAIMPYQTRKTNLQEQWKNKLEYEKYNDLYNNVEKQLDSDITKIQNKYKTQIENINKNINILISKR